MLNSRLHQAHGYPGDSSSTSSAFTYTQGQGTNPWRTSQNAVLTVLTFQAILMNDYGSFKKRISSFIREYQTGLFFRSRTNHSYCNSSRDQLEQEVNNLRSNFANLEALQHNTKVDINIAIQ